MALNDMTSLGRHPFDMFDAADELESIANNEYIPFVDVSWSYPKFMEPPMKFTSCFDLP